MKKSVEFGLQQIVQLSVIKFFIMSLSITKHGAPSLIDDIQAYGTRPVTKIQRSAEKKSMKNNKDKLASISAPIS